MGVAQSVLEASAHFKGKVEARGKEMKEGGASELELELLFQVSVTTALVAGLIFGIGVFACTCMCIDISCRCRHP
jgi:hypothetical protein